MERTHKVALPFSIHSCVNVYAFSFLFQKSRHLAREETNEGVMFSLSETVIRGQPLEWSAG